MLSLNKNSTTKQLLYAKRIYQAAINYNSQLNTGARHEKTALLIGRIRKGQSDFNCMRTTLIATDYYIILICFDCCDWCLFFVLFFFCILTFMFGLS